MTTYALLIYRMAPAAEPIPELDDQQALEKHRALQAEATARNHLHSVARLDEPNGVRLSLIYKPTVRWQQLSFEALRVFEQRDRVVQVIPYPAS